MDDSDDDHYMSPPKSPFPVAPKRRFGWLPCVKKQTNDENLLSANKVGASPSDLAKSRVGFIIFFLFFVWSVQVIVHDVRKKQVGPV